MDDQAARRETADDAVPVAEPDGPSTQPAPPAPAGRATDPVDPDDPGASDKPGPQPFPPILAGPTPSGPPLAPASSPLVPPPPLATGPPPSLPGIFSTIGQSLDLCVNASRDLRRASFYIGLLTLATVGPFAAVLIALGSSQGGFDWLADAALGIEPTLGPIDPGIPGLLFLTVLIAIAGYLVVSIEASVMAAAILAGRRIGRPLTMREALRRSRQTFWRIIRASLLVGLILLVPNVLVTLLLNETLGEASEGAAVVSTIVGAVIGAPFAYITTGVVLGDVGASEAVRRSVRLARAKWRLAIAISSVGVVVAYIQLFALGAGIDILARVGGVLGVGFGSGVSGTVALIAVILLGILSVGSLVLTLAALIVAPQVVAFLGLTAYGAGIERAHEDAPAPPRRVPWVTVPMGIVIVVGFIAGLGGVLTML
jgi:hypothetical protein